MNLTPSCSGCESYIAQRIYTINTAPLIGHSVAVSDSALIVPVSWVCTQADLNLLKAHTGGFEYVKKEM